MQKNQRLSGSGLSLNFDDFAQKSPRKELDLPFGGVASRNSLALNFNQPFQSKPKLPSPSYSETSDA